MLGNERLRPNFLLGTVSHHGRVIKYIGHDSLRGHNLLRVIV